MPATSRHTRSDGGQLVLQPQACRDQDLVIAAAAGMDLAADVAEALRQARFDRRMAVLESRIQHEGAAAEVVGERGQLARQCVELVLRQDPDALQALGMARLARMSCRKNSRSG